MVQLLAVTMTMFFNLGMATEHATSRTQFGRKLSEFGQIQVKYIKSIHVAYVLAACTLN
jgi:hypothetical protein